MFLSKNHSKMNSVWLKMRRYTAYFSVIGATLTGLRFYIISRRDGIPEAVQNNAYCMEQFEPIQSAEHNTLIFLATFSLCNLSLFFLSICMLRKERG